jgi:hypothetical protein
MTSSLRMAVRQPSIVRSWLLLEKKLLGLPVKTRKIKSTDDISRECQSASSSSFAIERWYLIGERLRLMTKMEDGGGKCC